MKKFIYCILSIILLFNQFTLKSNPKIINISIPKSGTWLINKLVTLLTNKNQGNTRLHGAKILTATKRPKANEKAIQLVTPSTQTLIQCLENLKDNEFLLGHLAYYEEYDKLLDQYGFKKLFIIRDPRDQLISRVFYVYKLKGIYAGLQKIPFDKLLLMLIGSPENTEFDDLLSGFLSYINSPKELYISNIASFYKEYLPWLNSKNCYKTRFEKLIGPKGGGNLEIQLKEIKNIVNYLNLNKSDNEIYQAAEKLFGGSSTFREGQIGSWKKHFKEEHKVAFKKVAGQLLIDLGYEKDFNW